MGASSISLTVSALEHHRKIRAHHDEYRTCPEAQRPLREDQRIKTYETAAKAKEVDRRKKSHVLKAQGTADRKSCKPALLCLSL